MATRSSILAWRVPWMEEPGGLQPTGSQRVGPTQRQSTAQYTVLLCMLHCDYLDILHAEIIIHYLSYFFTLSQGKY